MGFVVYGVIHLLVGVIAIQLAWGDGGGQADQSGAMAALAGNPVGQVVLWAGAVGFAALTVWWLITALFGSRNPDGSRALGELGKSLGKAVLFAALAFLSVRFALGSGGGGSEESVTATVLDLPGGQFIVGIVGVIIVAIGFYHVYKGVAREFRDDLRQDAETGTSGTAIMALGTVGYPAKGVAIGIVGVLFVVAAVQHDPDEAGGLDEALKTLLEQPFGPWLLTVVAVGIAAFGIYCFGRARYQRS